MRRPTRPGTRLVALSGTLALTCALALSAVTQAAPAGASTSTSPPPGYSTPVTDSYYPGHENAGIDVLRYSLDLKWLRKQQVLRGLATIRARSTGPTSSLRLALAGPLTVSSVTVDGTRATFTHTGGNLDVSGSWTAGQITTLVIGYRGKPHAVKAPTDRSDLPRVGWHNASHGTAWTMQEPVGAFTWYPVNDTPSDKAMYRVSINVPAPEVGVFNGRMVSRTTTNGRTVTVFRPGHPIAPYLTTIAIAPLQHVRTKAWDGTPITIWIPRNHPAYAKALSHTAADFRWLVRTLGPYPFDRVGIVVVPSASAMETQELVTLGAGVFGYGRRYVREVVVHELSHAWFGDTATPTDWTDLWMNEGFAMYYQAMFTTHEGWQTWSSTVGDWTRYDQYYRTKYGPPAAYDRNAFAESNVYICPARMLNRLSHKMGAASFRHAVRGWVATHRDSNVTRDELVSFFSAEFGQDLTLFFQRWLDSTVAPA